jgi:uncharacterized Zn finger protein
MWRHFGDWESTGPREVKDGIRAQTRGTRFASSWWGRRWLETLEGFGWDSRLQRGRSYARRGQVTDLKLGADGVSAGVQGSRPTPYRVKIRLTPLTDAQWGQAVAALEERPLFIGELLAGSMPEQIDEIFSAAGAGLFPQRSGDLAMSCSCPDYAVPCKHLAAVYYLLAEWLDRDPFLLFELRGRNREALLGSLQQHAAAGEEGAPEPEEPLSVEGFWEPGDLELGRAGEEPPAVSLALLRALGDPPGWSEAPLLTLMRPVYAEVSDRAARLLAGEEDGEAPE